MLDPLVLYLAGNLSAACTPSAGMGCYPCCGVTSSTSGLAESGKMGLGAAVLIIVAALIIKAITGGGR